MLADILIQIAIETALSFTPIQPAESTYVPQSELPTPAPYNAGESVDNSIQQP